MGNFRIGDAIETGKRFVVPVSELAGGKNSESGRTSLRSGQQSRAEGHAPARARVGRAYEGTEPRCSTFVLLSAFLWQPLDTAAILTKRLILPMKIAIGF